MNDDAIKYAVYPGSVTLYDGTVKVWSAANLAAAYGVSAEPYITINQPIDIPQGEAYFQYLHLVPRGDDKYQDIKYTAEDDNSDVAWRPDFDPKRVYIQETDPLHIYPDQESEVKLHS